MKKRSASAGVHSYIAARVDRIEVRSEVEINLNLRTTYPNDGSDTEPVVVAETWLEVRFTLIDPPERAGQSLELTIGGDDRGHTRTTLDDIHARDEHGARIYRQYRGSQLPVYKQPRGIARLDPGRPSGRWSSWVRTDSRLISDWLALLNSSRDLFLGIHEFKLGRDRWVQGIALQTKNPRMSEGDQRSSGRLQRQSKKRTYATGRPLAAILMRTSIPILDLPTKFLSRRNTNCFDIRRSMFCRVAERMTVHGQKRTFASVVICRINRRADALTATQVTCGDVIAEHFPRLQTEWHRAWKGHFPDHWQEIVHQAENGEKHIADVRTDGGWVLEFQNSYIRPEERRSRETFYPKLVWVVMRTRATDTTRRCRFRAKLIVPWCLPNGRANDSPISA